MHDPRRNQNDQEYNKLDLKGRTEAYLKLAM
jgi:tetratricopeptide (TPR) repeat protein